MKAWQVVLIIVLVIVLLWCVMGRSENYSGYPTSYNGSNNGQTSGSGATIRPIAQPSCKQYSIGSTQWQTCMDNYGLAQYAPNSICNQYPAGSQQQLNCQNGGTLTGQIIFNSRNKSTSKLKS